MGRFELASGLKPRWADALSMLDSMKNSTSFLEFKEKQPEDNSGYFLIQLFLFTMRKIDLLCLMKISANYKTCHQFFSFLFNPIDIIHWSSISIGSFVDKNHTSARTIRSITVNSVSSSRHFSTPSNQSVLCSLASLSVTSRLV